MVEISTKKTALAIHLLCQLTELLEIGKSVGILNIR